MMRRRRGLWFAGLAMTALVALAMAVAIASFLRSPRASAAPASSQDSHDSVVISPDRGLVGTPVTISIHADASMTTTANYTLGTTTTEPTGQSCSDSQPIAGLAPVAVPPGGVDMQLAWPASLDGGPYWLCANPTDAGSGLQGYRSYEPFIVLGGTNPPISVTITSSVANVPRGATMTIQVAHWQGYQGVSPTRVDLLTTDPATPIDRGGPSNVLAELTATVVSQDNQGNFTLTVTLPTLLYTGSFWLELPDANTPAYSAPFTVNAPTPTPMPHATPIPTGSLGASDAFSTNTIIVIALVALLAILAGIFAFTRLRRR